MRVRHPAVAALAVVFVLCALVIGYDRVTSPGPEPSDLQADRAASERGADSSEGSSSQTEPGDWRVAALAAPTGAPGAPDPSQQPGASPPSDRSGPAEAAVPKQLRIDGLDLREDLIDLGIARDGTMEVPADPDRVGWFAGGGRPGSGGPTVLAGHVDSLDGPAVFARLGELEPGDRITVVTADGSHDYRVSETRSVPQDDFPTAEVFGATRSDVLRLITCTGPYDREAGRYTENRVVTAVPA